ncbi:MAG: radical SAM protein, partial [Proteobacteria bacterium]|nr:radical SAM protein [Pseudomonadota bacterium]
MTMPVNPEILLITPPLTQINTPYPATAYLKGFLGKNGRRVSQADLGIELILALFSENGLRRLFGEIDSSPEKPTVNTKRILRLQTDYLRTIGPVIRFLQNKDATLAHRICNEDYLPEGPRFSTLDDTDWAFGSIGIQDRARFLATLYLEDISDLISEAVAPDFGFSRYAEKLSLSAAAFQPLEESLHVETRFVDELLLEVLDGHLQHVGPDIVGITVPFPGCLYGALKCGQYIKANLPKTKVVLGGGYVNTELRELDAPGIFRFVDFITADDGERPFLQIVEYLAGRIDIEFLKRTFVWREDVIKYCDGCEHPDIPLAEAGTPDYEGLPLDQYLSILEIANPMHRLWNDGRWNKITIARGCYWQKCTFC